MTALIDASSIAERMPELFGCLPDWTTTIGKAGVFAQSLAPRLAEVSAPASDAEIVCLVTRGAARSTQWRDGRVIFTGRIRNGSVGIVLAGVAPRATVNGLEVVHLYLPRALVRTVAEEIDDRHRSADIVLTDPCYRDDPDLEALGRCFVDAMRRQGRVTPLYCDSLLQAIVLRLLLRWSDVDPNSRDLASGGLASWQLKRAQELMLSRLDGRIGLSEIAVAVGLSETHFSRAFKQSTGIAPFRWLHERRVERAKELLRDGRLSLAEVALAVGFAAQSRFSSAFRRTTGTTPGRWRQETMT